MKSLNVYLCVSAIIVLSVILLLLPSFESPANAADRNWRYNEHGRNIDIDICVMCTQPGPQGPQGPPGDTRQTIVTLHDDAEGNAAGWNPPLEPNNNLFMIKAPFELEPGFSFEATFTNPPRDHPAGEIGLRSGNCHLASFFDVGDTIPIICDHYGSGDYHLLIYQYLLP